MTRVAASGASMLSMSENSAWRIEMTPLGGARRRSKVAFTSLAVSALPSWNNTPPRILNV